MKNLLAILILLGISGCSKEETFKNKNGLLVDYTGLVGCGWVIESEGVVFELTNLNDFPVNFKDSTQVKFSYTDSYEGSVICMVGHPIKLLSIKEN